MTDNESTSGVQDVRKSFGRQTVLDGVSFDLVPKEVTCVLGRSGTGKSVLLRLLIGLERADAGAVRLVGQDITNGEQPSLDKARKKVGFLFQQGALYDSMTIEENVSFPLRRHLGLAGGELRDRVQKLLSSVGMENASAKLPSQISGGMKKRVGLARALALEPSLVLFDEPTAGLDPTAAAEIAQLVIDLRDQRGVTCLVVTHDLSTARKISNRLITLDKGRVIFDGIMDEFEKSSDPFITQYLKDAA